MNSQRIYLAVISGIWFCVLSLWVYLSKPPGSALFQLCLGTSTYLGIALLAVGFALYIWSAIVLAGGVRQNAAGPEVLVVRGPYRHTRHPIYLAVALVFMGVWLLYRTLRITDLLFLVLTLAVAHFAVVWYEEPATRRRLGSVYDDYCGRVPRWIPRLSPAEVDDLEQRDTTPT